MRVPGIETMDRRERAWQARNEGHFAGAEREVCVCEYAGIFWGRIFFGGRKAGRDFLGDEGLGEGGGGGELVYLTDIHHSIIGGEIAIERVRGTDTQIEVDKRELLPFLRHDGVHTIEDSRREYLHTRECQSAISGFPLYISWLQFTCNDIRSAL